MRAIDASKWVGCSTTVVRHSLIGDFNMNLMKTTIFTAVLSSAALIGGGCANDAQTGTLAGAGIGALAGQAIGGNTGATLIGAGAGAVGGYIIGNEMDKKKAQNQRDQLQDELDRERGRNLRERDERRERDYDDDDR